MRYSPFSAISFNLESVQMIFKTTKAPEQATGFPPNVVPWSPGLKTFDNCQLTYIPQELLKLLLECLYTLYIY